MAENSKDDILAINQTAHFLKVNSKTVYNLSSDEREPGKNFAKKVG